MSSHLKKCLEGNLTKIQGKIREPNLNKLAEKVKKKKKTFYHPFIIKLKPCTRSSDLQGSQNTVESSIWGS